MIDEAIEKVRIFQKKAGQPTESFPKKMPLDRVISRAKWIKDEIEEFEEAETIYEQADALIDITYYLLGTFVECGLKADELFNIVHEANMKKLSTGEVIKENDLRVCKPKDWNHPSEEIKKVIDRLNEEKTN